MPSTPDKDSLRQAIKKARQEMTTAHRASKNAALLANIKRFLSNYPAPRVAAYSPLPSEPGGVHLLETLHPITEKLYIPRTNDDGSLSWGCYTGESSLERGMFNIPEPVSAPFDSNILNTLDLVLVPALAVDKEGYRLGKGAGFYDRALNNCTTTTATLVFREEILDFVPRERHDVPTTFTISDAPAGTE